MTGTAILEVDHLSMRFGGIMAVQDLSFRAMRGEITALIGPNGAGKTTVFNCLNGFYRPPVGRMRLSHRNGKHFLLERMEDFRIAREAKVVRTFQNVRLFSGMSVLENCVVAQHIDLMRASSFSIAGLLFLPRYRKAVKTAIERSRYWLDKVGLLDSADAPAGTLAYGAQRRLEIARAMCMNPELLCLDEPAAGLNGRESSALNRLLLDIRKDHGVSILLVEHDMNVVMQISDSVVVLDHGISIAQGTPAEIRVNQAVIRAYLGAPEGAEIVPSGAASC